MLDPQCYGVDLEQLAARGGDDPDSAVADSDRERAPAGPVLLQDRFWSAGFGLACSDRLESAVVGPVSAEVRPPVGADPRGVVAIGDGRRAFIEVDRSALKGAEVDDR